VRTSSEARELRHRVVPLTAPHLLRFQSELPLVIRFLEERRIPADLRWAIGAIVYGLTTMVGLQWFGWSPVLVVVHLLLSQWIPLLAEVLLLRRLQAQGMTRLIAANDIYRFVHAVISGLERVKAPQNRGAAPLILEAVLPDSDVKLGSVDKTSPGAIASALLFFGVIATGILAASLYFMQGSLRDELLSQPWALATLGAMSLLQFHSQFRSKLAAPIPGASWNVEFNAGLRIMSVMLLGMLSPVLTQGDGEEVWSLAFGPAALVAFWGGVALLTHRMWRGTLAQLRAYRDADPSSLLALLSRNG
jgi:hypothetical protein